MTGTAVLLRAALRRDRRRLLIWVLSIGLVTVYAAVALGRLYPTEADRQARAAVVNTAAGIMFSGPAFGITHYSLGAMIANEMGLSVMVAAAIMSIQFVVRHTRAQEENGQAELLLAGAVGRRAPLMTALALTALADLAVGVVTAVGLVATGLPAADTAALGLGFALTGLVFGTFAAVTAELLESARAASGTALGLLGVAVVVRGIGDELRAGGSPLSWVSPIAWAQQTRAFVALRWSPLLLSAALVAVLVAVAIRLAGGRDLGAGLLAPRRGPAAASPRLAGPAALLTRLQRGTVLGWTAALLVLGATFGSLGKSVVDMLTENRRLAEVFAAGGGGRLSDSFAASTALYYGACAAAFGIGSVLRLRAEETAGRSEVLLAGGVDRRRLLGSGLVVAAVGSALLLLAAGVASALAAAAATGDAGQIGRLVLAAAVQLPAVLVVVAVTAVLVAVAPRATALAWVLLVWVFLAGLFGGLLHLPGWALKLSPFGSVPAVPADPVQAAPLVVLTLVATAIAAVALAGFRRRDVPA